MISAITPTEITRGVKKKKKRKKKKVQKKKKKKKEKKRQWARQEQITEAG